jgi:hypothetical protein
MTRASENSVAGSPRVPSKHGSCCEMAPERAANAIGSASPDSEDPLRLRLSIRRV